jgi:hypothetical protein
MCVWRSTASRIGFISRSGQGIPLVCLHTAGADSRQYHLLADPEITRRFRVPPSTCPGTASTLPDGWEQGSTG